MKRICRNVTHIVIDGLYCCLIM